LSSKAKITQPPPLHPEPESEEIIVGKRGGGFFYGCIRKVSIFDEDNNFPQINADRKTTGN
jgi:hypothetical protein